MAKKDAKTTTPDKGKKKDKKAKGAKGGRASVAGHPRAAAAVKRSKGIGGILGFAIAALVSRKAGIAHAEMLERALIGGIGGMLLGWFVAVTVWRNIVVAEMKALVEQRMGEGRVRAVQTTIVPESEAATEAAAG